jgi:hypothetical protein
MNQVVRPLNPTCWQRVTLGNALGPTIFHEDWWLNAATNGAYEVAEVSNGGVVVGSLPYWRTRRLGLVWCKMPPLTPFLGPVIDISDTKGTAYLQRRMQITHDLILKLPSASFLQIKCHRDVSDVLAFQEQQFKSNVQFTHEIRPAPDNILWDNLHAVRRQQIKNAQARLDIATLDNPEPFLRFYRTNLNARGITDRYNNLECSKIIVACINRQRGRILAAKDKKGVLQAAIFCVWDATSAYYMMTTRSLSSWHGCVSALLWEAIKDASHRNLIFDFGGVGTKGSVRFYSDFGGVVRPRYVVTKMTFPVGLAYTLLSGFGREQFFY